MNKDRLEELRLRVRALFNERERLDTQYALAVEAAEAAGRTRDDDVYLRAVQLVDEAREEFARCDADLERLRRELLGLEAAGDGA